jgi:hypothetical protein
MAYTNSDFVASYDAIISSSLSDDGLYKSMLADFEKLLTDGGIDNLTKDQYLGNFMNNAFNTMFSGAIQGATEVGRIQSEEALNAAQAAKLNAESAEISSESTRRSALNTAEINRLVAEKNLIDEQEKSEVKRNETNGVIDKEIAQIVAETTEISTESGRKTALNTSNISRNSAEISRLGAEELRIESLYPSEKTKIDNDAALVARQTIAYNDELKVKKAEFAGQVAAFAVNSNSSKIEDAWTKFTTQIDAI